MPSGAKKRKAAKKKKEKETHNDKSSSTSNDNPQGNNDVNSQDERGTDGGGDFCHQDQFKERDEELGEKGPYSVRPDVLEKGAPSDAETVKRVELENDGGVRIERQSKQDSASQNVAVEQAESAKGSSNGDDRSSSSSSSDDESRVVDRRCKADAYVSVSEEKPHGDLVSSVDSSLPEVIQTTRGAPAGKTTSSVTESTPVESSAVANEVVKMGLENGSEKLLPTSTGTPVILLDPVSKKIEDGTSPLPNETAKASSSVVESVSKENESEVLPSLGTSLAHGSNDAESSKDPEIPEYSEKQPLVAPAPAVVQKTSWFSCCGILDVITGSSR